MGAERHDRLNIRCRIIGHIKLPGVFTKFCQFGDAIGHAIKFDHSLMIGVVTGAGMMIW